MDDHQVKKTFVGFGDSWAAGDELDLDREDPYIAILAKQHKSDYINYAMPGTSLPQLVIQFKKFLRDGGYKPTTRYCAVFFLTAKERFFAFHRGIDQPFNPRGIFPLKDVASELHDMNKLYYKYFYSDEFADYMTNVTLITLQQLCRQYNIQDYYIPGWQYNTFWDEVDTTKIYNVTCQDLLNLEISTQGTLQKNNPYFAPNISHPNQLGHQRIAEVLNNWISSST